ncbi:epidermal growth factor receptor kinase substrate 8-like protein 3b isoform X1 [Hippocampus zosterae]|uniref:epidermal growth factor receptor kinase substrate 8-like protein 3b isoform X1 n=1 Tax=Hippocampus zosterae TaxID=109293 RepID=UPI00223D4D13|nr:epidermal growth factor receptor kinase substrate 8-like protein 3b isoform X1 [Hippocampus zosterae]
MLGNSRPFSYSPRGFPPEELPHSRWAFQQDNSRGSSPPRSQRNVSRLTPKSIYMQRKEYSEVLSKQPNNLNVRVEHLLTCELDGQQLTTVDDCVTKLKRLNAKGRLWPQEMILEAQGGYLLLLDTESQAELEALPLISIQQTKAVLDIFPYDSLLLITARERSKRFLQVFIFQCEEAGADLLKIDLDKLVQSDGGPVEPRREQPVMRSNLENLVGRQGPGSFQQAGPRAVQERNSPLPLERPFPHWTDREHGSSIQAAPRDEQRERPLPPPERPLPPPERPLPQWAQREPDIPPPPRFYAPQEEAKQHRDLDGPRGPPEVAELTDVERNTEIFNHVLNDLEIFMDKVLTATTATSLPVDKRKKKGVFVKKKDPRSPSARLPPDQEFISCLQKIKYGFNLLGLLDGSLRNTSASDYIHFFFSSLATILPHYHAHLPPTVLSPLLTEASLRLVRQVVSPEEDQIWRSLGDSWNIPRSRWPDDDVPPYIPEFYDGWRPPAPSHKPAQLPYQNGQVSRSSSQRFPSGRPDGNTKESRDHMRVVYDFMARNNRELTVMKGEVVEVVQRSKQWWLVRNNRAVEGNVPQNVLEPLRSGLPVEEMRPPRGPPTLDVVSSPAEVRAWLQYKGFAKITVASLGVLTGKMLLQMGKDEMRTVCPEEGAKVFFQLQAIKSAIALASEPSDPYDARY